jgi:CHAD domain-containing protein
MPFYIRKNEPLDKGLRRIAREQIDIALENFGDETMPQHRQVHALRTRCKKMRALIRLVELPMGEVFHAEDQRFHAAGKALAAHREKEVLARTIQALSGISNQVFEPPEPIAPEVIENSLAILSECRSSVDHWPLRIHGFADIAPGFSRTYRKSAHAYREVLQSPVDQNFHRLRKWAKYHWYQVRLLERLNKPRIRKQRKKLRKLHLTLGEAHDLAVLQAVLQAQDSPDDKLMYEAIDRKNQLYVDAIRLCGKIFARSVDEVIADYARWYSKPDQRSGEE